MVRVPSTTMSANPARPLAESVLFPMQPDLRHSIPQRRSLLIILHLAVYATIFIFGRSDPTLWAGYSLLLVWISIIDLERLEIPDSAVAFWVLFGAVWVLGLDDVILQLDHLLGAIVLPLMLWAVAISYARWRGFEGLGFGDVKLMVALGLWHGWAEGLWVLAAAAISGALTLLVLERIRPKGPVLIRHSAIAFGPFLCFCSWVFWVVSG